MCPCSVLYGDDHAGAGCDEVAAGAVRPLTCARACVCRVRRGAWDRSACALHVTQRTRNGTACPSDPTCAAGSERHTRTFHPAPSRRPTPRAFAHGRNRPPLWPSPPCQWSCYFVCCFDDDASNVHDCYAPNPHPPRELRIDWTACARPSARKHDPALSPSSPVFSILQAMRTVAHVPVSLPQVATHSGHHGICICVSCISIGCLPGSLTVGPVGWSTSPLGPCAGVWK